MNHKLENSFSANDESFVLVSVLDEGGWVSHTFYRVEGGTRKMYAQDSYKTEIVPEHLKSVHEVVLERAEEDPYFLSREFAR